jgi:hypothetical protein
MKYIAIIAVTMCAALLAVLILSSCQKEIPCDNWGACDGFTPKCVPAEHITIPAGTIDCCENEALAVGTYTVMVHPELRAKVKDCLPVNLPDSAGYYKVVSKGVYEYNSNNTYYVQIGGTPDNGWYQHENSTYFFLLPEAEWNTITDKFKPQL